MVANGLSIQQADANISSQALISHTLVVGHGCGSALSGESTFHSYPLQQVSHAIEHKLFALSFSIFLLSRSIHFDASQLIFDFSIFYLFVHFLQHQLSQASVQTVALLRQAHHQSPPAQLFCLWFSIDLSESNAFSVGRRRK